MRKLELSSEQEIVAVNQKGDIIWKKDYYFRVQAEHQLSAILP
jgi:hypothetical protein